MTTDQATRYLGEALEFGGGDSAADSWLRAAIRHAKKTDWTDCGRALAAAYRALGATPPAIDPEHPVVLARGDHSRAGYAFYAGDHPIQASAVQAGREMDEWLDGPPRPVATTKRPIRRTPRISEAEDRDFRDLLASAESAGATIEVLDQARRAVASRADRLARSSRHRQIVIDLRAQYDRFLGRLLAMGWQ